MRSTARTAARTAARTTARTAAVVVTAGALLALPAAASAATPDVAVPPLPALPSTVSGTALVCPGPATSAGLDVRPGQLLALQLPTRPATAAAAAAALPQVGLPSAHALTHSTQVRATAAPSHAGAQVSTTLPGAVLGGTSVQAQPVSLSGTTGALRSDAAAVAASLPDVQVGIGGVWTAAPTAAVLVTGSGPLALRLTGASSTGCTDVRWSVTG